jgi:hypothetical protein
VPLQEDDRVVALDDAQRPDPVIGEDAEGRRAEEGAMAAAAAAFGFFFAFATR